MHLKLRRKRCWLGLAWLTRRVILPFIPVVNIAWMFNAISEEIDDVEIGVVASSPSINIGTRHKNGPVYCQTISPNQFSVLCTASLAPGVR
jgi:hypothetical protein